MRLNRWADTTAGISGRSPVDDEDFDSDDSTNEKGEICVIANIRGRWIQSTTRKIAGGRQIVMFENTF
jgi:hypothetical protein